MIRVVVVDDEALVRSGFEMILDTAADVRVVGTANGADAVETVRRERPDVLLLDIRTPDVDGLTVPRAVRALPHPPVVAMPRTFDTDEYVLTAPRCGAVGFLPEDTGPTQPAQLARTPAGGGVLMSPKASDAIVRGHPATATDPSVARAGGIKDHVSAILAKLRVGSRVQAALLAQRAGLLSDRGDRDGR
ncbi:response regulator transcription factor [Embleya hyalina]|uniref:DNA-binding response regulator n=1 Tax=Embleya hyalina TaxID=516124 RepID=A0A401YND3_9ACTN|nr:response regulator transcription factor [Embleya hyalina]GCD96019.1 DNA-binding response regulator [Embleya hyalina]